MDVLSGLMNTPVGQGLIGGIWGTALAQNDMVAREVERGEHAIVTAIFQIGQVDLAESLAATAFNIPNVINVPLQFALTVAIGGAHYWANKKSENGEFIASPEMREWVHCITSYITPLSRITNIVSVVALFYFGNIVMGSCLLVMYGVALLDKAGYLPELAQKVYYSVIQNEWFIPKKVQESVFKYFLPPAN